MIRRREFVCCAECTALVPMDRITRRFCGEACSNRFRQRAWYRRHHKRGAA